MGCWDGCTDQASPLGNLEAAFATTLADLGWLAEP